MVHLIKNGIKTYSQGLFVAGCLLSSTLTLGYILDDSTKLERNRMKKEYETKINILTNEIIQLKSQLNNKTN